MGLLGSHKVVAMIQKYIDRSLLESVSTYTNAYEFCTKLESMIQNGMIHQSTCPHTPQQNGIVERKHCHSIETTHTLLIHANAPLKCWGYVVLTASYLINRMSSSSLNNKVPHSFIPCFLMNPF